MRRWGLILRDVTARSSGVIVAAAAMVVGIAAPQAVADPGRAGVWAKQLLFSASG
jgi:hypothetical protein